MKKDFVYGGESGTEAVLEFLSKALPFVTKNRIKQQLRLKEIKINGERISCDAPLKQGDKLSVFIPDAFCTGSEVAVVYEDANILIADKPAGADTENHLKSLLSGGREFLEPVHRLDRNTTGLVIFALNSAAETEILRAVKERCLIKKYIALCEGIFDEKSAEKRAYIKKDSKNSLSYVSGTQKPGYKEIITKYKVIDESDGVSRLEIIIVTGRTHQIRAHMAYLGHPVVGDGKYGTKFVRGTQKLTAVEITFEGLKEPLAYLNGKTVGISAPF